jgi:two-component system NtrC family sensor kinase
MSQLSQSLLDLIPHGYCLSWQPHLLWLHGIADLVTALAYYTIPVMLLWFVRRRRDLQFSWIFVLFGIFIMACGATHVMSLWTMWFPDYLAAGLVKAVTALASVGTAVVLFPLLPKALALPGPAQWKAVHDDLRREIAERQQAEDEVRRLNSVLERRVAERTTELLASNRELSLLQVGLEERVQQRTAELQAAQAELLSMAHQAGMAEIATNVLHNVGNVLNSVNVSVSLVSAHLRTSKLKGLARAVGLMDEHAGDLGEFLTLDARGKLLPAYLRDLVPTLEGEHAAMAAELLVLDSSVDHIKEVVATQQSYAGRPRLVESLKIGELLDDALRMNAGSLTRHKVNVVKNFAELPALPLDRNRVLQILVNLISNAKHAMSAADLSPCITLMATLADGPVLRITVADNGEGIAPENLTRIFSHGFTTRKDGHGFGLHSSVLAAQEMGGSLTAHSNGPGQGTTFTIDLPIHTAEGKP